MEKILHGDCLQILKTLDAGSLDSLVTDPPAGISFMGKDWDGDKGGREGWITWLTEVMRECYRVLKPGAHGLVWAIPRTSHWSATALENAGFEIRDVVTHLFATGFPKSLDVSKAIDKAAGAQPIKGAPKPYTNENIKGGNFDAGGDRERVQTHFTTPATDAARQWQGWGTALKPASEHWILVRKPLGEKTVAANVLKHGTGGINIDGCRIATDELTPRHNHGGRKDSNVGEFGVNGADFVATPSPLGRFPANLVLSHNDDCEDMCSPGCAVAALDEQSGIGVSRQRKSGQDYGRASSNINMGGGFKLHEYADSGGASRFFYCAKASKSDRGEGNTHPTVKSTKLMTYLVRMVTPPGGVVLDPFMGSGSTGVAAKAEGMDFVGIEQDETYITIAQQRLE